MSKRLSFCLLTAASPLMANPAGGQVVAGSASVQYGNTTVVTQHSNSAIVNWQNFSIAPGETTQFVQPSAQSVILNRVVGADASQIMGNLKSNGAVFLVNPNGVMFGPNSHVNVGSLLVTTASISNADFMAGNYHFTNAPDGSTITNQGHITVAQRGYAALVAPNVQNMGTIKATLGKVTLGSGKAYTLDLYGDNLIVFDANALFKGGSVTNKGKIKADGGTVVLSTAATTSLVESMINMYGVIQARSVTSHNGKVMLIGATNSKVNVYGTIDASGARKNQTGGLIQVTGTNVNLLTGSELNVQGTIGGGTVNVGGGPQGTGTLAHAYSVLMDSNAIIDASALQSGNGGNISVWSDANTQVHGTLLAQGGAASGKGGYVETSGDYLDVLGINVNTRSPHGAVGTWLLDPYTVTIGTTDSQTFTIPYNPPVGANSTINVATINTALFYNNVIIGAGTNPAGQVIFNNTATPITLATNALTGFNPSFTVYSLGNIVFNSGATITNSGSGAVTLEAGYGLTGNAGTAGGTGVGGTIVFNGATPAITSTGAGTIVFYYTPTTYETPKNYASNISLGGTSAFTPYMLVNLSDSAHSGAANTLTATDAGNISSALIGNAQSGGYPTSVLVFNAGPITFGTTSANPITWNTNANFVLQADATLTGTGTINVSGPYGAPLVNPTGAGSVSFYYSPTSFETPITNFVSSGLVTIGGTGSFSSTMQVNMNLGSTPNTITNTDATAFNTALESDATNIIAYDSAASLSFANSTAINWNTNQSLEIETLYGSSTNDLTIGSGGTAPYITASGSAILNLFSSHDILVNSNAAITDSSTGKTTWMANDAITFNTTASAYTLTGTGVTSLIASNAVNLNNIDFQAITDTSNKLDIISISTGLTATNTTPSTAININTNAANIIANSLNYGTSVLIDSTAATGGGINFNAPITWQRVGVVSPTLPILKALSTSGDVDVNSSITTSASFTYVNGEVILDSQSGNININIVSGIDLGGVGYCQLIAPTGNVNLSTSTTGFNAVNAYISNVTALNWNVTGNSAINISNYNAFIQAALVAGTNVNVVENSGDITFNTNNASFISSITWNTAANLFINAANGNFTVTPGSTNTGVYTAMISNGAGNISIAAAKNINISSQVLNGAVPAGEAAIQSKGSGSITLTSGAGYGINMTVADFGNISLTGSNISSRFLVNPLGGNATKSFNVSNSSNTTNIAYSDYDATLTNSALLYGTSTTVTSLDNINFTNSSTSITLPGGTYNPNFTATTNNVGTNLQGGNINLTNTAPAGGVIQNNGTGTITLTGYGTGNVTLSTANDIINNSTGAIHLNATQGSGGGSVYLNNVDFNTLSNPGGGAITATAVNLFVNNSSTSISVNSADTSIISNSLAANTNVILNSTGDTTFTSGNLVWGTPVSFTVNANAGGNINFTAGTSITMNAGVGSAQALTLNAGNTLTLAAANTLINNSTSRINLDAASAVYLNNADFGTINNTSTGLVSVSTPNLYASNTGTLTVSNADATFINTALNAGSNVTLSSPDNINFANTATPISWSTAVNMTAIADSGELGTGTIGFNGVYSSTPGAGTTYLSSTGSGSALFYYDSLVNGGAEVATNFANVLTFSGSGSLNPYLKVFELAPGAGTVYTINTSEGGYIQTALNSGSSGFTPGTNVIIYGPPTGTSTYDVNLATASTISSWTGSTSLSINAVGNVSVDSAVNMTVPATGILNLNPDTGSTGTYSVTNTVGPLIYNNGTVNILYNPVSFNNNNPYFYNAISNPTGLVTNNAPAAFQLVYNTVSGHTLADIIPGNGDYVLSQNISQNLPTTPIASFSGIFSGYDFFDVSGNASKTITGLSITSASQYVGLFGLVSGGTIENVSLTNPNIVSTYVPTAGAPGYTGAIAAYLDSASQLLGAFTVAASGATPTVTAHLGSSGSISYMGGLFGYSAATVSSSASLPTFSAVNNANINATSASTITAGSALASGYLGGILGYSTAITLNNTNTLTNTGNITVSATGTTPIIYAGGILSTINGTFANNLNNTGNITLNMATTTLAASGSTVLPTDALGGIAATMGNTTSITGNLSNQGSISVLGTNSSAANNGTADTAGIISLIASPTSPTFGSNTATWTNTGTVLDTATNTTENAGGILGVITASNAVTLGMNMVNTGAVTAGNTTGAIGTAAGLVALITGTGTNPSSPTFTFSGNLSSNSSITSNITSAATTGYAGGLFGQVTSAGFTGAFTLPTASHLISGYNAGGIFESLTASSLTPTNASLTNLASVSGSSSAGGIGTMMSGSDITVSSGLYNTGVVFGNTYTGGLVAQITENGSTPSIITSPTLQNTGVVQVNNTASNTSLAVGGLFAYFDSSTITATSLINTSPTPTSPLTMSLTLDNGGGYVGGVFGEILTTTGISTITASTLTNAENITLNNPNTYFNTLSLGGVIGYADGTHGLNMPNATLTNNGYILGLQTTVSGLVGGVVGTINNVAASVNSNNNLSGDTFIENCTTAINCKASVTTNAINFTASNNTGSGGGGIIGIVNNTDLSSVVFDIPNTALNTFFYGGNGVTGLGSTDIGGGGVIGLMEGAASALSATTFTHFTTNEVVNLYVGGPGETAGGLIANVLGGTIGGATPLTLIHAGNITSGSNGAITGGIIGMISNTNNTLSIASNVSFESVSSPSANSTLYSNYLYGYAAVGGIFGVMYGATNASPLIITNAMSTPLNNGFALYLSNGNAYNYVSRAPACGGLVGSMYGYSALGGTNTMSSLNLNMSGSTSFAGGVVGLLETAQIVQGATNIAPLSNTVNYVVSSSIGTNPTYTAGSVIGEISGGFTNGYVLNYDTSINIAHPLANMNTGATSQYIGGFTGAIYQSNLTGATGLSNSTYTVSGGTNSSYIGGLIGSVDGGSQIQTSLTNSASVSGTSYVGGLIGTLGSNRGDRQTSSVTAGTISNTAVLTYGGVGTPTLTAIYGGAGISAIGLGGLIGSIQGASSLLGTLALDAGNSTFVTLASSIAVGGVIGYITGSPTLSPVSMTFSGANGTGAATINGTNASAVGSWIGEIDDTTAFTATLNSSNVTVLGQNQVGGVIGFIADASVIGSTSTFTNANTGIVDMVPANIAGSYYAGGIVGQIGGVGVLGGSTAATVGGTYTNSGTVGLSSSPSAGTYYLGGDAGNINNATLVGTNAVNPTAFINHANISISSGTGTSVINLGGNVGFFSNGVASGTNLSFSNTGAIQGTTTVGGNIAIVQNGTLEGTVTNSGTVRTVLTSGTNYLGGNIGEFGNIPADTPIISNATLTNTNTGLISAITFPTVGNTDYIGGSIGYFDEGDIESTSTLINNAALNINGSGAGIINLSGIIGLFNNGNLQATLTNNANITNINTSGSPAVAAGDIAVVQSGFVSGILQNYGAIQGTGLYSGSGQEPGTAGNIALMTGGTLNGTGTASLTNQGNITGGNSGLSLGGQNVGGLIGYFGAGAAMNGSNTLVSGSNTPNLNTVSGTSNVGGLFGYVNVLTSSSFNPTGGTLTNNAAITATSGSGLGGVIGNFISQATSGFTIAAAITNNGRVGTSGVSNSSATGGISGTISGLNNTALITFSGTLTNTGAIYGGNNTGGLIGTTSNVTINSAVVLSGSNTISGGTSGSNVGGIIGLMSSGTTLSPSSITLSGQTVSGVNNIGGFIGEMLGTSGTGNLATFNPAGNIAITGANITGTGTGVGSLIGFMSDYSMFAPTGTSGTPITISTNSTSTITGAGSVGGLFGSIATVTTGSSTFNPVYTQFTNAATVLSSAANLGGIFGNVTITGASIDSGSTSTYSNTGTVGHSSGSGNVSNTGGILGNVVGSTGAGIIRFGSAFTNSGSVYGTTNTGGIAGNASFSSFTNNLLNSGSVTGTSTVGGLFGSFGIGSLGSSGGSQTFSNTATVLGSTVGGLIGALNGGTLYGSYSNAGTVGSLGSSTAGGLFGVINSGTIANTTQLSTSNTSYVSGNLNVGGLIGNLTMNPFATGNTNTFINGGGVNSNAAITSLGGIFGVISGSNLTLDGNFENSGIVRSTNTNIHIVLAVGGITGMLSNTTFSGTLTNNGTVSGLGNGDPGIPTEYGDNVGGLFGIVAGGSLTGTLTSTTFASVHGLFVLGGLIGEITGTPNITPNTPVITAGTVSGHGYIGGAIGYISTFGLTDSATWINNAVLSGSIHMGGIIGLLGNILTPGQGITLNGTYVNNANFGDITLSSEIGGIVGGTVVNNTFSGIFTNNGQISGVQTVGGIVGGNEGNRTITFNRGGDVLSGTFTNNGVIQGTSGVGGIVGGATDYQYSGTFTNNATINGINTPVTSPNGSVGGIIGAMDQVTGSSFTAGSMTNNGSVTTNGLFEVGGVVGELYSGATFGATGITTATNNGTVTGSYQVGGIIGYAYVANVYGTNKSYGSVTGNQEVGGIIGYAEDTNLGASSSDTFIYGNGSAASSSFNTLSLTSGGSDLAGIIGHVQEGNNSGVNLGGTYTIAANVSYVADSTTSNVGGMIGLFDQDSTAAFVPVTISAVLNNQPITVSANNVGGVIGQINIPTAPGNVFTSSLSNSVSVSGGNNVGGIVGLVIGATMSGSLTNTGNVNGLDSVGGLIGTLGDPSAVSTSLTGTLSSTILGSRTYTAQSDLGGLVGQMYNASLSPDATNTVTFAAGNGSLTLLDTITPTYGHNMGGIVGEMLGTSSITTSYSSPNYSTVSVTANSTAYLITGSPNDYNIGGIVGLLGGASTLAPITVPVTNASTLLPASFTLSDGGYNVGGFIGQMNTTGTLSNPLSNSIDVTANNQVGGIIGLMAAGTVDTTLSDSGNAIGTMDVGGLIGKITGGSFTAASLLTTTGGLVYGGFASSDIGGLVGNVDYDSAFSLPTGQFTNAASVTTFGTVSSIGGIFGVFGVDTTSALTINPSLYNTGSVYSSTATGIGGIMGSLSKGTFNGNLTNSGAITGSSGTNVGVGGLFGIVTGGSFSLTSVLSTSGTNIVSGSGSNIGGLIGNLSALTNPFGASTITYFNTQEISSSATIPTIGGLFGNISGGYTISNPLTNYGYVHDVNATAIGGITGQLVGGAGTTLSGNLSNVYDNNPLDATYGGPNSGSITGANSATNLSYTGGLIGYVDGGTSDLITSSALSNSAVITGGNYVGGLFGAYGSSVISTNNSTMTNSGNITGVGSYVGGVLGKLSATTLTGSITDVSVALSAYGVTGSGSVSGGYYPSTGTAYTGGLIGYATSTSVLSGANAFSVTAPLSTQNIIITSTATSATSSGLGALIGSMDSISGASSFGRTGSGNIGTFAPALGVGTQQTISVNGSGISNVGGLIGYFSAQYVSGAAGLVNNSSVSVTAGNNVGGVAGFMTATNASPFAVNFTNNGQIVGSSSSNSVGGIFGKLISSVAMTGTTNSYGSVSGNQYVGGIIGQQNNAIFNTTATYGNGSTATTANGTITLDNSTANALDMGGITGYMTGFSTLGGSDTISANVVYTSSVLSQSTHSTSNIGGVVGLISGATPGATARLGGSYALSSFTVTGSNVGGYIGQYNYTGTTADSIGSLSLASGINITGGSNVGGIIGNFLASGSIANTDTFSNSGSLTATGNNAGGIIGLLSGGAITGSLTQAAGTITAFDYAGGVVGQITAAGATNFSPSLFTATGGSVSATDNGAGGLIGYMNAATINSHMSTSNITVTSTSGAAGGLVGVMANGAVLDSSAHTMSTGSLFGISEYAGGLVGVLQDTSVIKGSGFSNSIVSGMNAGGSAYGGGVVGELLSITALNTITALASISNVSNATSAGGIAGYVLNSVVPFNLTNTGGTLYTVSGVNGVGGLIGTSNNSTLSGTLTNHGTVSGTTAVGGVLGLALGSTLSGIMTDSGNVTGTTYVGGIAGEVDPTTLSGAYSLTTSTLPYNGIITGTTDVGGLFGYLDAGSTVAANTTMSTGANTSVTGSNYVGGLIGNIDSSTVYNVTASTLFTNQAAVSSSGINHNTGGIFGGITNTSTPTPSVITISNALKNEGHVSNTSNSVNSAVGGIMGEMNAYVDFSGALTNTLTGTVSGKNNVGGIFGIITGGTINNINVQNAGTITGTQYLGGISGNMNGGTLYGTYSNSGIIGTIANSNAVGGLFGIINAGTIENSAQLSTSGTSNVSGNLNVGGLIGNLTMNPFASGNTNTFINGGGVNSNAAITSIGGIFGVISGSNLTLDGNFENSGIVTSLNSSGNVVLAVGGITGLISNTSFTGTLTNNGTVIGHGSGGILSLHPYGSDVGGLFGKVTGGTISGTLSSTSLASVQGNDNTGGLIGEITGTPSITPATTVTTAGSVSGRYNVGGAIGFYNTLNLTDHATWINNAVLSGDQNIGGFVGLLGSFYTAGTGITLNGSYRNNASFGNSSMDEEIGGIVGGTYMMNTLSGTFSNYGTIIGSQTVGGIVGGDDIDSGPAGIRALDVLSGTFTNNGQVQGVSNVGGIVGILKDATYSGVFTNNAIITGIIGVGAQNIGGIIGAVTTAFNASTFSAGSMTNNGMVTASTANQVGGIAGTLEASSLPFGVDGVTTATNNAVVVGAQAVGGLFGYDDSSSVYGTNHNYGSVTGTLYTGGIIGQASNIVLSGTLTNDGTIAGTSYVGGIIGSAVSSTVSGGLSNNSSVTGNTYIGGIAGQLVSTTDTSGSLSDTSSSAVTGNQYVGGLIGESAGSTVTSVMNFAGSLGFITTGSDLGAVIGYMTGSNTVALNEITLTSPTLNVNGSTAIGAVAGLVDGTPTFTGSFGTNAITINGATDVGVIIGEANNATLGAIANTTNLTATGSQRVGGIAGFVTGSTASGTLSNSGVISGNTDVGGVIGYLMNSSVSGNLTDTGTGNVTGQLHTGGIIGTEDNSAITGKSLFYGTADGVTDTGAIVGYMINNSSLTEAGNIGTVEGTTNTGGIVGDLESGTVTLSYNNSNHTVIGVTNSGGIAGFVDIGGSLVNITFGGTIDSTGSNVGGITGYNLGTITNALSEGTFNTSTAAIVGALAGDNTSGTIATSVFDTRAYALAVGAGSSTGSNGYDNATLLYGPTIYTNIGWNFASLWATSTTTTANYPVLQFCTVDCTVPLRGYIPPIPPAPSPINPVLIPPNLIASFYQTQASNQASNPSDPSEYYFDPRYIPYELARPFEEVLANMQAIFGSPSEYTNFSLIPLPVAVSELDLLSTNNQQIAAQRIEKDGINVTHFRDVIFIQEYYSGMTKHDNDIRRERDIMQLTNTLTDYYHGKK